MEVSFREANEADLPAAVALLADDVLGREREDASLPLDPAYLAAFREMRAQGGNRLIVAEARDPAEEGGVGRIVGCLQLVVLPGAALFRFSNDQAIPALRLHLAKGREVSRVQRQGSVLALAAEHVVGQQRHCRREIGFLRLAKGYLHGAVTAAQPWASPYSFGQWPKANHHSTSSPTRGIGRATNHQPLQPARLKLQ